MIKFGTSGWRGLIARDFTFYNVRLATKGISDDLSTLSNPPSKVVIMDYEWVAFRASGTEPLIRCYIEAKSQASLKKLRAACRRCSQRKPHWFKVVNLRKKCARLIR